jgi:hypothetical protein
VATDSKDFKVKNGLIVAEGGTFGGTVTVAAPTSNTHAATKLYVDDLLGSGGSGSITVSDTPPSSPSEGDLWYNSTDGSTYVYYDSFWVESTSAYAGPTGMVAASAPLSFDEATSTLTIDLSSYYTSAETDAAIAVAVAGLVDSAPATLDTLNELSAALGDDENFATTVTNSLAAKIDSTEKGANDGVATLDSSGQVPASQLANIDLSTKADVTKTITSKTSDYILAASDVDTIIEIDTSSPTNLTLPADNIDIAIGESIDIINVGSSNVNLVPGSATLSIELDSSSTDSAGTFGPVARLYYFANPDRWFILTYRGQIVTSTDTYSWTKVFDLQDSIYPTDTMADMAYDGNSYIVVAYQLGFERIYQSTDGINWTDIKSRLPWDSSELPPYGIAYGNNTWSIVSKPGNTFYSTDGGTTWSAGTTLANNASPLIMAYEGGIFFAGGDNGYLYTSTDGQTFTALAQIGSNDFLDVAYGNGVWVLVGFNGELWRSTDGTNWSTTNINYTTFTSQYDFWDVTYGDGLFYAVGFGDGLGGDQVLTSPDGLNWTLVTTPSTASQMRGVVYANNVWLLMDNNADLLRTGTVEAEIISNNSSLVIPPGNTSAKLLKRANNSWLANIEYTQSIEDSNTISSIMGVY